jgi:hypothetical protein
MADVEAASSGIATCYLSKVQMTALLRQADGEGLSRQQIVKRAVIELLVKEGALPQGELDQIVYKQQSLASEPMPHLKPVAKLRNTKVMTPEDKNREERNRAYREYMHDNPTQTLRSKLAEEEPEEVRPTRRRRRRTG